MKQSRQEQTIDAVYSTADDHAVQALSQLGRAAAWAKMQRDEWQRAQGIDGFDFPALDLSAMVEDPPPEVEGAPPPPPPGPPVIAAAAMKRNAQVVGEWVDNMRLRLPALYLGPLGKIVRKGIEYDQDSITNLRVLVRDSNLPETSEAWFDPIVNDRSYSLNGEREGKYAYARKSATASCAVSAKMIAETYRNADYGEMAMAVVETMEAAEDVDLAERLEALRRRLEGADPRVPILARELLESLKAIDAAAVLWSEQPLLELPDDLWLTAADLAQAPDCLAAISILSSVVAHADGPPDSPMRGVPMFHLAGAGLVLQRVFSDLGLVEPVSLSASAGASAKTIQKALSVMRAKRDAIGQIAAKAAAIAVLPKVGERPHVERAQAAAALGLAARQLIEQLEDVEAAVTETASGEIGGIQVPAPTRDDGLVLVTSVADIQGRLQQAAARVSQYAIGFTGAGEFALSLAQERYRIETLIGFYAQSGMEYQDVPCDRTFRARIRWDRAFSVEGMAVAIRAHHINRLDSMLRGLAMQLKGMNFGSNSPKEGASPAAVSAFAGAAAKALLTLAEASFQYRQLAMLVAGEQASMRADGMVPALEAARAAVGFRPTPPTPIEALPDPSRSFEDHPSAADPMQATQDQPSPHGTP